MKRLLILIAFISCSKEDQGYICTVTDCYDTYEVWIPSHQADSYCDDLLIECKCKKL